MTAPTLLRAVVDEAVVDEPRPPAFTDVLSEGSGTGVPYAWVPEPATWALMIMGFTGMGAALRHRRRASHAA